jgi:hypothetical protein
VLDNEVADAMQRVSESLNRSPNFAGRRNLKGRSA